MEESSSETKRSDELQKVTSMIQNIDFAMFTSRDLETGNLRSRPMMTQVVESDGNLWFLSRNPSPKMSEIKEDSKVNIAFADPKDQRYVSISGVARVVTDKEKLKELWSPKYSAWFPDGLDDPQLAAICVNIEQAEYWNSPSSTMVHLYGMVKAKLTGKPANAEDIGADHGKVDLQA